MFKGTWSTLHTMPQMTLHCSRVTRDNSVLDRCMMSTCPTLTGDVIHGGNLHFLQQYSFITQDLITSQNSINNT